MESMEEAIEVEEEEGERSRHDHEAEPVGALPLSRPLHFLWLASSSHADLFLTCRPIYRGTSLIRKCHPPTGVPHS